MGKTFNIAFVATSAIGIEFFEQFRRSDEFKIKFVMTKYEDLNKKGRNSIYRHLAHMNYDIPIYTPSRMKEVDENIFNGLDCVILVAYGHIIPERMLDRAVWINMHASLLPDLRGASPIQYAIMKNYDQTGLTATVMVSKLDAGPIIDQIVLSIDDMDTTESLSNKMSSIGGPWFIEVIKKFLNKEIVPYPQNDVFATFAPSITDEDRIIDWNNSAVDIHNKIRALYPNPCATAKINNNIVKIIDSKVVNSIVGTNINPGDIIKSKKNLMVKCGSGAIEILKLVPQSGKVVNGIQFICGINRKLIYS